jgi:hypothetical protein
MAFCLSVIGSSAISEFESGDDPDAVAMYTVPSRPTLRRIRRLRHRARPEEVHPAYCRRLRPLTPARFPEAHPRARAPLLHQVRPHDNTPEMVICDR